MPRLAAPTFSFTTCLRAMLAASLVSLLALSSACMSADDLDPMGLGDDQQGASSESALDADDELADQTEVPDENEDEAEDEAEDDPQDESEDETTDETQAQFELLRGTWVVIESELTHDGCGLTGEVDRGAPGSLMDLLPEDSNRFELTFDSDGSVSYCNLEEDLSFFCDPSTGVDDRAADYGLDATILVDRSSEGHFVDQASLVLASDVELVCQGPDCTWVNILLGSSFPCSMAMESSFVPQDETAP
jgi:hypothetical protein